MLADKPEVAIVVGVVDRDGETMFFGGQTDGPRVLDGDTVFEIGSITKVLTTAVLAKMVRRGQVHLDDPVRQYLPPEVKVPSRNGKEITLVQLATHTSGLPIAPTDLRWHVLLRPSDWENPYAHYGPDKVYAFLAGCELTRDPGQAYEYSNLGMGLLGMALTRAAHAPSYEQLVRQEIADVLNMPDTRIALDPAQRARFAEGHDDDGDPVPAWDFAALEGFGALRSTVHDLLHFLAANVGLLPAALDAALADCQEPRADTPDEHVRVGLGWHILQLPGGGEPVVCHSGETGGYRAFLGFRKAAAIGVVVLNNSDQFGSAVDRLGLAVLDRMTVTQPDAASR
jgi:CubicO group peptidase (beta-lactamase class C family)